MSSPRNILVSTAVLVLVATGPASANGDGATIGGPPPGQACTFAGPALDCVAAADEPLPVIVARFAHPGTAQLFTDLGDDYSGYRTGRARERLRRSLERNNERSVALIERVARDVARGRAVPADLEAARALHLRAFQNYRVGIMYYQRAQWFDPTEPPDRGPDEPQDAPTG